MQLDQSLSAWRLQSVEGNKKMNVQIATQANIRQLVPLERVLHGNILWTTFLETHMRYVRYNNPQCVPQAPSLSAARLRAFMQKGAIDGMWLQHAKGATK